MASRLRPRASAGRLWRRTSMGRLKPQASAGRLRSPSITSRLLILQVDSSFACSYILLGILVEVGSTHLHLRPDPAKVTRWLADIDAKDDHRALRARSAECIPVGSKDLVESELISTLAFSPPPK